MNSRIFGVGNLVLFLIERLARDPGLQFFLEGRLGARGG